jgi:rfaE bifunctional protein kinase chain/domain
MLYSALRDSFKRGARVATASQGLGILRLRPTCYYGERATKMDMKTIDLRSLMKAIEGFGKIEVLVVGDIMLDQFIWGRVSRISPEAPVPVVEVDHETTMLGGAANVVNNIVSLGGKVSVCGAVGDDYIGRQIFSLLNRLGVNINGIVVEDNRPTTLKTRIIAHAQQVVRYDKETRETLKPETTYTILDFIHNRGENLAAIIVSDYGKGVVTRELMEGLKDLMSTRDLPLAVDPNVRNFPLYKGVTIITPNHNQAQEAAGIHISDEESLRRVGEALLKSYGCRALLITRGEEGMTLFEGDGGATHIKVMARKVYDVTGAGDTVIATLTLGIASGLDLKSAAYLSNVSAGIVVGEVGTSAVKKDDLKALLGSHMQRYAEEGEK